MLDLSSCLLMAALTNPQYNPYVHGDTVKLCIVCTNTANDKVSRETDSLECLPLRGCGRRGRT